MCEEKMFTFYLIVFREVKSDPVPDTDIHSEESLSVVDLKIRINIPSNNIRKLSWHRYRMILFITFHYRRSA